MKLISFRSNAAIYAWVGVLSVVYATLMLDLDEKGLSDLHNTSHYHRIQAEALLNGRFSLGDSVEDLKPGLAWSNGNVQQVWGLGIAVWFSPFVAFWSGAVPERIPLGVATALLTFFVMVTGIRISRSGHSALGLGLVWITVLCPALWMLFRCSRLVFEETVLYAVLLSLGILTSLVRVSLFNSRVDLLTCYCLCAFSIWIRPTHAVYGVSAALLASLLVWQRGGRSRRLVWFGTVGMVLSFAGLMWTNTVRFGKPLEFGHKLTVSSESMVYLTRFGNPFRQASAYEASKELFGALFLASPTRVRGSFEEDVIPLQSEATRWRRLDLSSFDLSYAAIACCGIALLFGSVKRSARDEDGAIEQMLPYIACWAAISFVGLWLFYLYYPVLASRYLLDFAPALVGFVVSLWAFVQKHFPRAGMIALVVWSILQIATSKTPLLNTGENPYGNTVATEQPASRRSIAGFEGRYTISEHPSASGIPCNGIGWNPESGFASPLVTLVVDSPRFIEINATERRMHNGEHMGEDAYQAQIAGERLVMIECSKVDKNVRVVFKVPEHIRNRTKEEVAFLCFSEGYGEKDRRSERIVHSVRWR